MASCFSSFVLFSCLVIASLHVHVSSSIYIVKGLSWSFYEKSCPKVESVIRKHLKKVFEEDIGQVPGLLRLHFHDFFIKGCDASVLLDGSASEPSKKDAPPNQNLRRTSSLESNAPKRSFDFHAFQIQTILSILVLILLDNCNISYSGGPQYDVPLGRRDGLTFASVNVTAENLPPPAQNASQILTALAKKNFDATDVVALSGGDTTGLGHCGAFTRRLYPTQDPTMEKTFAHDLKGVCPTSNSTNTTVLDIRSPDQFDNRYFVDLVNRQGLFHSDQDLYEDPMTRGILSSFAEDQELFFEKFVFAMTKMGQLDVLTGTEGEIRANCSVRNLRTPLS
ncbi:peroxidase 12-like [Syzygium oleosum]|uniref:peroxidase 12-like n=1 Tax=Syzygium oleosum TaxID=219896 RepID=UPI0024B9569A|nr:peroxidase 12-like [Syzygium oleosum]